MLEEIYKKIIDWSRAGSLRGKGDKSTLVVVIKADIYCLSRDITSYYFVFIERVGFNFLNVIYQIQNQHFSSRKS